ncbi:MAG: prepilin-type N-terminal cleavage/methylation domain-containing protein [Polyangiales bacterium]
MQRGAQRPLASGLSRAHRLRAARAGMTLIEIMIVIVVIAIGTSAASFGLGSLTKASLQSACVRLGALSRYAYHRALTNGTTVRITFDLEKHTFAVTEAHGRVTLVRSDAELRSEADHADKYAFGAENKKDDDEESAESGAAVDPWELARQRIEKPDLLTLPPSPFGQLTSPDGAPLKRFKTQPVGDDVKVHKVIVAHEAKPREEGKTDLFFFPSGLTQHAVVQLMDRNDTIYSVEIHPLTGKGKIHDAPFEPEVLMDNPDEHNQAASQLEDRK